MTEENKALSLPEKDLKVLTSFEIRGNQLKDEATKLVVESASDVLTANSLFKQTQLAEKDIEAHRKVLVAPINDFLKQVNALAKEVGQATAEAKLIVSQKLLAYNERVEKERQAKAEEERKRMEKEREEAEVAEAVRAAEEKKKQEAEEARLAEIGRKQEEERKKIAEEQNALKKKELEIEAKRLEEQKKIEQQRIENERAARKIEEDKLEIERQKKLMAEAEEKKKRDEAQAVVDAANKPKGLREQLDFEIINSDEVPRQYCSPDDKKIRAALKAGITEIAGVKVSINKRIQ